jgi:hypothetical protein
MKKKLILAVVGAAALGVPRAEAVYYGRRLHEGGAYTFRINDATVAGHAATLLSVTRGRLEVEDVRAAAPAEGVEIPFTVAPRATRIILALDIACTLAGVCDGQVTVNVVDANGNTVLPPVTITDLHQEIVLDVAP